MGLATAPNEEVQGNFSNGNDVDFARASERRPTILVATTDQEIRNGLAEVLEEFSLDAIWLQGVEAAKNLLAKQRVSACLCGFWLQDGTYRELVRHIRRERAEIPIIIVSAPACPDQYRDYLAGINVDFLSHPYRKSDLERMLKSAIGRNRQSTRQQSSAISSDLLAGEAA